MYVCVCVCVCVRACDSIGLHRLFTGRLFASACVCEYQGREREERDRLSQKDSHASSD